MNLMNPMVGLQAPPPPQPQGMQPGLMGNAMQPPSLMNSAPGNWSQVAYQMAGSPKQGGLYPSVAAPPTLPGTTGTSGGTGSAIGGTALGIIAALAKNPALMKSAGNGISSLWNAATGAGSAALPAATAYGTNAAVAPASALTSELPATATGTYSAAPAAATGLMSAAPAAAGSIPLAAGAGAVGSTAGALGAGAPGVFASGSAAAGSGGAAAGGATLGAAGTAAAVAAPFLFQQAGLALGDAWTAKNTQGNEAMKGWMHATGATYKPSAGNTNVGQSTFGSPGQFSTASHPGTMYGPNGQPMTPTQAANAIYTWAVQHGINPGDFHPS